MLGIGSTLLGAGLTGLGDLLGGGGGSTTDTAKEMMDYATLKAINAWRESQSNAAGQTGEAARAGFRTAFAQPTQTAGAISSANALKNYARMLTTGVGAQSRDALDAANRNARRMRQAAFSNISGGTNPAAVAASADRIAESFGSIPQNLIRESGDAYTKALTAAGGLEGQAGEVLVRDRMSNYETRVRPFENKMESLGSILSPLVGLSSSAVTENRPTSGLANYLGGSGAQIGVSGLYNSLYGDTNNKNNVPPQQDDGMPSYLKGSIARIFKGSYF